VNESTDGIDANQTGIPSGVKRKTAPRPIFGMDDQFSLDRIHVHVVEFLDELGLTPDDCSGGRQVEPAPGNRGSGAARTGTRKDRGGQSED
jgi:hypothetical protein